MVPFFYAFLWKEKFLVPQYFKTTRGSQRGKETINKGWH